MPVAVPVAFKGLDQLEALLRDEAFWSDVAERTVDLVVPLFLELFLGGVESGARYVRARDQAKAEDDDMVALTIASAPFQAEATMYVRAWTTNWYHTLEAATRAGLTEAIVKSRAEGWSLARTTEEVGRWFGPERARRIAVTETTRLFGAGAQFTYRQLGITWWHWRTAEDARVDPTCDQLAAGGPYPMDHAFSPAHVSCRCWPAPVSTEEQAELDNQAPPEAQPDEGAFPDRFDDLKALERFMEERHPGIAFELTGGHMDVMLPTMRQLDVHLRDFPGVARDLTYVGTHRTDKSPVRGRVYRGGKNFRGEWAHADGEKGRFIGLNPGSYGKPSYFRENLTRSVAKDRFGLPFHPVGADTFESVITHEFGHLVEGWARRGGKWMHPYIAPSDQANLGRMITNLWADAMTPDGSRRPGLLSRYAQKNKREGWAEAFSASYHSPPSVLAEVRFARDVKTLTDWIRKRPYYAVDELSSDVALRESFEREVRELYDLMGWDWNR